MTEVLIDLANLASTVRKIDNSTKLLSTLQEITTIGTSESRERF